MSSGAPNGVQLTLDFPRRDPATRPLIETQPYEAALAAIRRWRDWPDGQLAIVGENRSGRSRLLHAWSVETGAALVTGPALAAADMDEISELAISALAIDDADVSGMGPGAPGLGLLAALNLCRQRQAPVLLAGRSDPVGWYATPPDLRSRLTAMPVAHIEAPDEETLLARLREACLTRHLNVPASSLAYLAGRMPRFWSAIDAVADRIETTRGRAYTLKSAKQVLASLGIDPGG